MAVNWLHLSGSLLVLHLYTELLTFPSVSAQGPYHTGTTSWTLFHNSWPVLEVFEGNWSSTVHGSDTAYALDMYASWCGHCQRFAPTWKRIASGMYSWRHVIQFGALACSHPDAEKLCIDQTITKYPTIKFFPPNAGTSYTGTIHIGPLTETALRMGTVDFLSSLTEVPNGFPDLRPIRSTVELLDAQPDANDRNILIFAENITDFQDESNYLGRYVILDVSDQWRRLVLRRIVSTDAANLGIREFPSLHQVNPEYGSLRLIASHEDRRGFVSIIRKQILQLEDAVYQEAEEEEPAAVTPSLATKLPDGVHDQDLESSVFFALWHEVAFHKNNRGARLAALKTYVHHLAELLPVRRPVQRWLQQVDSWLSEQPGPISRDIWLKHLEELQSNEAYIPKRVIWTGCKGNDPAKRGYPCSLWTTFHALTIAAHNDPNKGISSRDVVLGIKEYVHRYFSCGECNEHFMKMSANIVKELDESSESGVLWLWSAHNKVNRRLHGDPTEDPVSKKMQFPTYRNCSSCHVEKPRNRFVESEWDEKEVMEFLVDFYSYDNIIRDTLPYTYIARVTATPVVDVEIVSLSVKQLPSLSIIFELIGLLLLKVTLLNT